MIFSLCFMSAMLGLFLSLVFDNDSVSQGDIPESDIDELLRGPSRVSEEDWNQFKRNLNN